jgi:hypothetical protein
MASSTMAIEEITAALTPLSSPHRRMVRETLRSILDSIEFSKSNRYPALLKYTIFTVQP